MRIIYTSIFILFAFQISGQITWEKLFSKNSTDNFRCVREVPTGGYIAAGYTANFSANDTDAFVVRLNINGDTLWTYTYNGPMSKKDLFYKVIPTLDGGFALCGYTSSLTGISDDLLYLKLSSTGQQQWVKFFGGTGKERGQDIIQTSDGNYTIVGYSTSTPAQYYDAFMLRADTNGDTLWTKLYGSANYDDANTVKALSDGGFIFGGQSNNGANGFDQFIVRTNFIGNEIWSKKMGSVGTDNLECLTLTSGGFILAGSSSTVAGGDDDGYLVKTDTAGTVLWTKLYGDTAQDDMHRVENTSDGGFIITGTTSSYGDENPNLWFVKTNSTGDTIWNKTFGRHNHDHGYSGEQTSDGGYILAGHTGSFGYNFEEAYILKMDSSGNIDNQMTYTSVFDMLEPTDNSCGSTNSQIQIVIKNYGRKTVQSVPLTISVSGAVSTNFSEVYNIPFEPEVTDTITLSNVINTSLGGTYTFFFSTGNNNDVYPERNTFTKTINIKPQPSLNLGVDTAVSDSSFLLDAGAGLQYSWDTGTNSQTYTVVTSGSYCVTVTGANSCTNSDCIYVVVSVGVDEINPLINYIYPNPASTLVYVELLSDVRTANLELMNSSGELLVRKSFSNQTSLDVSTFPKGIYLMKVVASKGIELKKIIID